MTRPKRTAALSWEVFLPITHPSSIVGYSDLAPPYDAAYLQSVGIDPLAPTVLRALRDDVLPFVRGLGDNLLWFSFLVHDRHSGVPAPDGDDRIFIHLRLRFAQLFNLLSVTKGTRWLYATSKKLPTEIAGVDTTAFEDGAAEAWRLLGEQSAWFLRFLESHAKTEDAERDERNLVRHMRQFLHFFANMSQMRVS